MSRHFLLSLSPATERAWAAGLFDGEGSTYSPANSYSFACLAVEQSHSPEVLVRFQAAVGGIPKIHGPYGPYKGERRGPRWKCAAAGFEAVQAIIAMLWPYLSGPKRQQAREVLLNARCAVKMEARTHCPAGHLYSPENTYIVRKSNRQSAKQCRTCSRIRSREYQRRVNGCVPRTGAA